MCVCVCVCVYVCVCDNSCDLRLSRNFVPRSAEFMSLKKTMLKDIEKGVKTHDFKSTETMTKKLPISHSANISREI